MMSLLTPAQLAAHLNVSERTVARMVVDGCPHINVRSRRKFDLAQVIAWTQQHSCQHEKTRTDTGTRKRASMEGDYIDASRLVRLRVRPSA